MFPPKERLGFLRCTVLSVLLLGLGIGHQELSGQVYRAEGTGGATLDQPAAGQEGSPSPGAGARPTVFNSYRCPAGRVASVAAALQEEFGKVPEVRIVPVERTSQILVLAPAEIQERISARVALATPQEPAPAIAAAGPALPPSSKPAQPIEIRLGSTTAARLEASLVEMLGSQLRPLAASAPDASAYRLMLKSGEAIDFSINHRSNRVMLVGGGAAAQSMLQLIGALDTGPGPSDTSTQLVPLGLARPIDVQRTIAAIRLAGGARDARQGALPGTRDLEELRLPLAARLLQPKKTAAVGEESLAGAPPAAAPAPAAQPGAAPAAPQPKAAPGEAKPESTPEEGAGLIGQVDIQVLEGIDGILIRGHRRDIEQVKEIIKRIEEISRVTEPEIRVFYIRHVDNSALGALVKLVYQEVYSARLGNVSITPLVRPNALLLIGRKENVEKVVEIVNKLDVDSLAGVQHKVFPLKNASAAAVQTILQGLFPQRVGVPGAPAAAAAAAATGGLASQVTITADTRANTLIVQAPPREMAEIAALIQQIDTDTTESINEIRQFQLIHMLADQVALILQNAILAQTAGQAPGAAGQAGAGLGAPLTSAAAAAARGAAGGGERSAMLQFVTADAEGERKLTSGILFGVQITTNPSANTIIVTGPAKSMGLIAALIKQLDQPPTMRAEIKVFAVERADATTLVNLLMQLFAPTPTMGVAGAAAGAAPMQTAAVGAESSLIPLRFAPDTRTNTIIATGTPADLTVVHAIILRLDREEGERRENVVRRLKNAPADYVASAITNFLGQQLTVEQRAFPGLITPLEQIEREVVVVGETVTNSLIISATKRYMPVIEKLIEDLDRRPEMVEIRVLIAEVDLTNVDEFGMELGIQEPVLFRRSVSGVPGFNFNTPSLGNNPVDAAVVGTQALSNLAMGRSNADAGFGGLVLSASSQSVSVLIRALKSAKRLEVLASPKITTMNNQQAYVLVGQSVPQVTGLGVTNVGTQSGVTYTDVGVSLMVTPRVSPDGMVVMQVTAERSDVGPLSEGIPIGIGSDGTPILSPRINSTRAETVVSAADGQTVVLGGLINKQRSTTSRKVPYLADVPLVGSLFRYDVEVVNKTELLIILTPTVIASEEDMERLKRLEAGRISWCLSDVIEIFGDPGVRGRRDEWRDEEVPVTYPDLKTPPAKPGAAPSGNGRPEVLPTPEGSPGGAASPGATPPLPPMERGGNPGANLPARRVEPLPRPSPAYGPGPETPASFLLEAPPLYSPPNPLRGAE